MKQNRISPSEIRERAIAFSREYKDAQKENAEAQSFWNDFFHVFGISRKRVASFEHHVKLIKSPLAPKRGTKAFTNAQKKRQNSPFGGRGAGHGRIDLSANRLFLPKNTLEILLRCF